MDAEKTLDEIGFKYHTLVTKEKYYDGGDKLSCGQNFTSFYHEIMAPIRNNDIKLMEIGIFNGKSIAMWVDYFPNGTIYGVDQSLVKFEHNTSVLFEQGAFMTKKLTYIHGRRIHLHVDDFLPNSDTKIIKCNTLSDNFMRMTQYFTDFNIIIDDGNHNAQSQCRNFELLFPKIVSGGMYIIEDIVQPTEFYSAEYFNLYFNKDSDTDQMKIKYVKTLLEKNEAKRMQLNKKLSGIENLLTKNLDKEPEKLKGLLKSKQEKLHELDISNAITDETYATQFDTFIEVKKKLLPLIDRIETRPNNIIFYKK